MSFLLPAFLATGFLVGLPVLLHLLRRRPREFVAFPSLRFLRPVVLRESRRHRIRRWLVLAMRCLLLLLVAAAFARPFFGAVQTSRSRAMLVLVDNSFSMGAGDRWQQLLRWAEDQAAELRPGDQLGVMLMNPAPTWIVPMTTDVDSARHALHELKPDYFATRYGPALRLAGEVLKSTPASWRELVWVGDHQRLGWQNAAFEPPLPAGIDIRFSAVPPAPARQAAIRDVDIRRTSSGITASVAVQQFNPGHAARKLSILAGDKVLAQRQIELNAGKPARFSLDAAVDPEAEQSFVVRLDPDDLPADDIAYATLEASDGIPMILSPVAMKPGEADFFARAIESTGGAKLEALRTVPWNVSTWPPGGVAILRGAEPFTGEAAAKLTAFLDAGGCAWLLLDGNAGQVAWLKSHGIEASPVADAGLLRLRDWDVEHPLLAPFAGDSLLPLLSLEFDQGWALKGSSLSPIALWGDRSIAIAETPVGRGRLLITGFNTSRGSASFSLSPAFVPLVHRAATWLAHSGEASHRWHVGEPVALPGDEGAWTPLLSPVKAAARSVSGSVIPTAPGIYQYEAGAVKKLFAVNVPEEESDLVAWPSPDWQKLQSDQPAPPENHAAQIAALPTPAGHETSLWWWLLLAAVILLLMEVSVSNRTAL